MNIIVNKKMTFSYLILFNNNNNNYNNNNNNNNKTIFNIFINMELTN